MTDLSEICLDVVSGSLTLFLVELGSVRKVGSQAEAYARHAYHRSKAAC